jgi:hypothetical protein
LQRLVAVMVKSPAPYGPADGRQPRSSTNALKRLFHTPFFAHRRKRWKTLFQLPNSLGRSRHGAPARTNQSTAFYEQSIVLTVAPSVTFLTRNKRLNTQPLRVRKCSPNQDRPLQFRS